MGLRRSVKISALQVHTDFIACMPAKLIVVSKVVRALYTKEKSMARKMPSKVVS
jgi:hypothetical protein